MVFIQVKKIHVEKVEVNTEFIRADKIETFRNFVKNPSHPMGRIQGDITKIMMKNIGADNGKPVYEIYINENEVSFAKRLAGNGITVINDNEQS
jgi:hypothetical protein